MNVHRKDSQTPQLKENVLKGFNNAMDECRIPHPHFIVAHVSSTAESSRVIHNRGFSRVH